MERELSTADRIASELTDALDSPDDGVRLEAMGKARRQLDHTHCTEPVIAALLKGLCDSHHHVTGGAMMSI